MPLLTRLKAFRRGWSPKGKLWRFEISSLQNGRLLLEGEPLGFIWEKGDIIHIRLRILGYFVCNITSCYEAEGESGK